MVSCLENIPEIKNSGAHVSVQKQDHGSAFHLFQL